MTPSSFMRPGTAAFAWPAGMMPSPIIWVMMVTVVARLASSLIIWLWSIASDRCWVRRPRWRSARCAWSCPHRGTCQ